jgi:hypothetical protein
VRRGGAGCFHTYLWGKYTEKTCKYNQRNPLLYRIEGRRADMSSFRVVGNPGDRHSPM